MAPKNLRMQKYMRMYLHIIKIAVSVYMRWSV